MQRCAEKRKRRRENNRGTIGGEKSCISRKRVFLRQVTKSAAGARRVGTGRIEKKGKSALLKPKRREKTAVGVGGKIKEEVSSPKKLWRPEEKIARSSRKRGKGSSFSGSGGRITGEKEKGYSRGRRQPERKKNGPRGT